MDIAGLPIKVEQPGEQAESTGLAVRAVMMQAALLPLYG